MKWLTKLRERRVRNIEREVNTLNAAIELAEHLTDFDDERPLRLRERRKALWLERSNLVRKLPPIYPEETTTP